MATKTIATTIATINFITDEKAQKSALATLRTLSATRENNLLKSACIAYALANPNDKGKEQGVSYSTIADAMDCSKTTCNDMVTSIKYAISEGFLDICSSNGHNFRYDVISLVRRHGGIKDGDTWEKLMCTEKDKRETYKSISERYKAEKSAESDSITIKIDGKTFIIPKKDFASAQKALAPWAK